MKECSLFTIGIIAYKNYEYIYDALQSVLDQTYPCIQIIITNDGSCDFDEQALKEYIEKHKADNIKEVIICNRDKNVGTVRNIQYILEHAKGEFYMVLAADDALYDSEVFQKYVSRFQLLGEDAMVLSARVAMCTQDINEVEHLEPSVDAIDAIVRLTPAEMFGRLSYVYTVPAASTCYRRKVFDLINGYDLNYFLIEDAPLFIKLARNNIKFYWMNGLIATRHRDGGISHGNTRGNDITLQKYYEDELRIYENEVIPYKSQIKSDDFAKSMEKYNFCKWRFYNSYLRKNMSFHERFIYVYKEFPDIFKDKIYARIRNFWKKTYYYAKEVIIIGACLTYLLINIKVLMK